MMWELFRRTQLYFKCFLIVLIFNPYEIQCGTVAEYENLKANYGVLDPYQLPENQRYEDLDKITDCDNCPRVYFPACGTDQVTYVNVCVLQCLKKELQRYGPCIIYRRSNRVVLDLAIPKKWRTKNDTFYS